MASVPIRLATPVIPLLFVLVLTACATPPPAAPPADRASQWLVHRAQLAAIRDFELQGRIGVRLEGDSFSATLFWRQRGDVYQLRVVAPLGRGTFELSGDAVGVQLVTADNRVLTAVDPETLLQENLGWSLPVSGLRWWIRGLPRAGIPTGRLEVSDSGWAIALSQQGWDVGYAEHRPEGALMLPARLTLENGPVRVRVSVSDWNLDAR